jgi:hypothetical protein
MRARDPCISPESFSSSIAQEVKSMDTTGSKLLSGSVSAYPQLREAFLSILALI